MMFWALKPRVDPRTIQLWMRGQMKLINLMLPVHIPKLGRGEERIDWLSTHSVTSCLLLLSDNLSYFLSAHKAGPGLYQMQSRTS